MTPEIVIRPKRGLHLGLRDLWEYRELLFSLIEKNIRVRYKQTLIGAAWAIFQPLFMVITFSIVFGKLAKIPAGEVPYPVFTSGGVLLWSYFSSAISGAANSLVDYRGVITKVYFPRVILPLVPIGVGAVDFAVALLAVVGMMLIYGYTPSLTIIWSPVFFLLTAFTALSIGLWLAAWNALYRDVRYVLPYFIQVWLFASPVVYPTSLLPTQWQWLYALNPMVGLIEGFRWSLTGQGAPSVLLGVSLSVVGVIFLTGLAYFHKIERTLVDRI